MFRRTFLVAAAALSWMSLAGCSRSTDRVETEGGAQGVQAVSTSGRGMLGLRLQRGRFAGPIATVLGDVENVDGKLLLGQRSLFEDRVEVAGVGAVFDAPGQTRLMVSVGVFGASCATFHVFLTLKSDGSVSSTDWVAQALPKLCG